MLLIGVDYHPSFQAIAFFVEETGECGEQELNHRLENHAGLPFEKSLVRRGSRDFGVRGSSSARFCFDLLLTAGPRSS